MLQKKCTLEHKVLNKTIPFHHLLCPKDMNTWRAQNGTNQYSGYVPNHIDQDFDSMLHPSQMRSFALVSDEGMKDTMKQFVLANRNILKKFRLTGTNYTMTMIKDIFKDDPSIIYSSPCRSGPREGNADLVSRMRSGRLGGVIFFQDPMLSHRRQHKSDIDCLCRHADIHNTMIATNPTSALMLLTTLRVALKENLPELLPSFFCTLQSPSCDTNKKDQNEVIQSHPGDKIYDVKDINDKSSLTSPIDARQSSSRITDISLNAHNLVIHEDEEYYSESSETTEFPDLQTHLNAEVAAVGTTDDGDDSLCMSHLMMSDVDSTRSSPPISREESKRIQSPKDLKRNQLPKEPASRNFEGSRETTSRTPIRSDSKNAISEHERRNLDPHPVASRNNASAPNLSYAIHDDGDNKVGISNERRKNTKFKRQPPVRRNSEGRYQSPVQSNIERERKLPVRSKSESVGKRQPPVRRKSDNTGKRQPPARSKSERRHKSPERGNLKKTSSWRYKNLALNGPTKNNEGISCPSGSNCKVMKQSPGPSSSNKGGEMKEGIKSPAEKRNSIESIENFNLEMGSNKNGRRYMKLDGVVPIAIIN